MMFTLTVSINFFLVMPLFFIFYFLTIFFVFNFFKLFFVFFKNDVHALHHTKTIFLKSNSTFFKNFIGYFLIWNFIVNDLRLNNQNFNVYMYYTYLYYCILFAIFWLCSIAENKKLKNFDQLYSYNVLIVYPPILLYLDNVINFFFSLELLNLIIFYHLVVGFNKNFFFFQKKIKVSTNYFYSLLLLCIINFFTNIMFFWSLNYVIIYTSSLNINYWNWFFDNLLHTTNSKHKNLFKTSNLFLSLMVFSLFLKLSLGPVSTLKIEIYKNLNIWTIIFYSTIYMYILLLLVFKKFFFLLLITLKNLIKTDEQISM